MTIERFDGVEAWSKLPPATRGHIGAIALELAVAWHAQDCTVFVSGGALARAADAADAGLIAALGLVVAAALPEVAGPGATPRIPLSLGPICRDCGCTENDACSSPERVAGVAEIRPCAWAEADRCTACAVPMS